MPALGSSLATTAGAPALLEIATYSGSAALPVAPLNHSDNSATPVSVQSRRVVNVIEASELVTPASLTY